MTKVLMLGWEYPPHISGGLGIACEGLSKGLARLGADITFIVPQLFGGEDSDHMRLCDTHQPVSAADIPLAQAAGQDFFDLVRVPALLKPYWSEAEYRSYHAKRSAALESRKSGESGTAIEAGPAIHYGANIFDEVLRYGAEVIELGRGADFDVIHAHDWMTFPAGAAVAQITGKPLVVHIHSLEHDRSGASVNHRICEIEKMGLEAARAIIAVSHFTKCQIQEKYGIPAEKIYVVHNGIYPKSAIEYYRKKGSWGSKVVLFLGRITFQKGPNYFVEAAAKVVPHLPSVRFVMAGSGDMLPYVSQRAKELGIARNFAFPGFLREKEVEEMFSVADLYVMPSVSEPFGLAALEAISFDTPAIISRQTGVSEVLGHTLKFDFWDVDRLADLIINGLLYDELRADMIAMARNELQKVRWDSSAERTLKVYAAM